MDRMILSRSHFTARIMCLGGVTLDRVFLVDQLPAGAFKTVARDFVERGGGMAATAAVAVAALGGNAKLLTRVGDDTAGRVLVEELQRVGVDTSNVLRVPEGRTATSAVHIDSTGERMLTNFRGHFPGDTDWLPLSEVASQSAVLADIRWPDGAAALLGAARSAGIPSILDADAGDPASLSRLATLADHAVFSEQGLLQISGSDDPETGLRIVRARMGQVVGVTLGARGSLWLDDSELFHVGAIEVDAINSNGVGDVFHGAYALAIGGGTGVPEAARFATLAAAVKCRDIRGWDGMPTRASIHALQAECAGADCHFGAVEC